MKPNTTLAASIALLTAAVAPVGAVEWNVVVTPNGQGEFWLPDVAFIEYPPVAFGPTDEATTPLDLGRREAPWQTVYAEGYWSNGNRGMDGNVKISAGCALVVRGGLIIGTTGLSCPR